MALSVSPIPGENGGCKGAVLILRDLTQIKKLEEKVRRTEKLAAIGKLASSVAHEIRNPLSSIRGFAQYLGREFTDRPDKQKFTRIIVKEVDRINRVVTDLLVLSRPRMPELTPTDIGELIDHSMNLTQPDAESHGVSLTRELPVEPIIWGLDVNQMTQVLLNLILNALDFSPEGAIVEVGARRNPKDTELHLWVSDDGPGIGPETKTQLFDPFFTTRKKGSGLGLAIVKKIVENHGGTVDVISPPENRKTGCRFEIRIPTAS